MVKTVGFKTQTHEATASQRTIYHETNMFQEKNWKNNRFNHKLKVSFLYIFLRLHGKFDTLEKNHWSKQLYSVKSREFQIINYNYNFTFFYFNLFHWLTACSKVHPSINRLSSVLFPSMLAHCPKTKVSMASNKNKYQLNPSYTTSE